jgi:hypothetical protein
MGVAPADGFFVQKIVVSVNAYARPHTRVHLRIMLFAVEKFSCKSDE